SMSTKLKACARSAIAKRTSVRPKGSGRLLGRRFPMPSDSARATSTSVVRFSSAYERRELRFPLRPREQAVHEGYYTRDADQRCRGSYETGRKPAVPLEVIKFDRYVSALRSSQPSWGRSGGAHWPRRRWPDLRSGQTLAHG